MSRRNEIWRWTSLARTWLDAQQLDVRSLTPGDMERFVRTIEPTSGPTNPYQRKSALRKLQRAALGLQPPLARRGSTMAARVDEVPARSPLGKAVARVLARARTESDRRRTMTCLGAFLRWCDVRGIAPEHCWPGDLDVYRRERLLAGYTSPGEYRRVAGWLLVELCRESL